jgi:dihydrofolate reductase
MAKLIYSGLTSLDGYTVDANGSFEWAAPDEEVHTYVNDFERAIGTSLYGRRMYEVMQFWEDDANIEGEPPAMVDYARLWRDTDKIVYSTTITEVASERTRIEKRFDPDGIRRLKADAARDISIGGPSLAAHALRAGLVDEIHQFVFPVVVGGGTRFLPGDLSLSLELTVEHRFASGVVHLGYRVTR